MTITDDNNYDGAKNNAGPNTDQPKDLKDFNTFDSKKSRKGGYDYFLNNYGTRKMSKEEKREKNEQFLSKLEEQLDKKNSKDQELQQSQYEQYIKDCTFKPYVSSRTNEIISGRKYEPASKSWKKNVEAKKDWTQKAQEDRKKEIEKLEEENRKGTIKPTIDKKDFSLTQFLLRNKDWKQRRDYKTADKSKMDAYENTMTELYDFTPKTNRNYNKKHIKDSFYKRLKSPAKSANKICRDEKIVKECTFKPYLCNTSLKIPFYSADPEVDYNKALYKNFRQKKSSEDPKKKSLYNDKNLFLAANSRPSKSQTRYI